MKINNRVGSSFFERPILFKMKNELEKLLKLAQTAGASHAEVYQSRSLSRPVSFEANRLKQLESSQSEGIALRLWRDGSPGLAVAYGAVDPQTLVEKAIAISQLNPPEDCQLVENRSEIISPQGKEIAVPKLIEIGKNAIDRVRDLYPEVICSAEFESEIETTRIINTKGLDCQYTEISSSYYLGVEWVRGEDFLGIYEGDYTKEQIDPEKAIANILQRLEWAKSNATPPVGKLPILFTPSAAAMLWETIGEALNGKRVIEESSPWSENKGKIVLSKDLTISQQPDREPFSCPFDDEGNKTQHLSLINSGRLERFYSDLAVGKILGTGSTGNGFRPSLGRYPTPELVNLVIEPGFGSLIDLSKKLVTGAIVDRILGGGADISGDFSVNIDLGYRVEQGEIVGRIKDTMIAGNVYDALKQNIILGGDRSWEGSIYTPSIILEELSAIA